MAARGLIRAMAGAACLATCLTGACERAVPQDSVRLHVERAPDYMRPDAEVVSDVEPLSEEAQTTIARLREIIDSNSLYQLARFADAQPGFISNFAGASHREHWDLLRRTGFDPILRMGELLDGPYGTREVGGQTWYIWPELAALDPDELQLERLNFRQRARLGELVGEAGIAEIRQGSGYPGIRMAISTDGRWLYYVHEMPTEE